MRAQSCIDDAIILAARPSAPADAVAWRKVSASVAAWMRSQPSPVERRTSAFCRRRRSSRAAPSRASRASGRVASRTDRHPLKARVAGYPTAFLITAASAPARRRGAPRGIGFAVVSIKALRHATYLGMLPRSPSAWRLAITRRQRRRQSSFKRYFSYSSCESADRAGRPAPPRRSAAMQPRVAWPERRDIGACVALLHFIPGRGARTRAGLLRCSWAYYVGVSRRDGMA